MAVDGREAEKIKFAIFLNYYFALNSQKGELVGI